LFSEIEGLSIEKYFINLRIEKVKELLIFDELFSSQIANVLHLKKKRYNLSNQFKKVTGFSPHFSKLENNRRIQLDQL
jgi:AraC-like DNA-binding protein